jgi:hypothetical protein
MNDANTRDNFLLTVRALLLVGSTAFILLYAFTVFVALFVSGRELIKQPETYYAALGPIVYAGFCILTGLGVFSVRKLKILGFVFHPLVVLAFYVSFLEMGHYLLALAGLWFIAYWLWQRKETPNSVVEPTP